MTTKRSGRQAWSGEDAAASQETNPMMQVGLQGAEDLIPKFSGHDKTHSVAEWIQDVEDNAEILQWTPIQQLIFARRALVGTAALWLKSERPFKTWKDLKYGLTKEFPDSIDQKTLHEMMSSRKKRDGENCMDYLLVMKEIGRRGKMADYVAIKYIIEGIQDAEIHKIMLYGASTYPELKEKLRIYETLKEKMKTEFTTKSRREPHGNMAIRNIQHTTTRCYNCGDISHQSKECPNKHLGLKCFKCNCFGHIASSCKSSDQAAHTSRYGSRDGGDQSGTSNMNFAHGSQSFTPRTFTQSFRQVGNNGGEGRDRQQLQGPKRTMFTTDFTPFSSAGGNIDEIITNDVPVSTNDVSIDRNLTAVRNEVMLIVNNNVMNEIPRNDSSLKYPGKDVKMLNKWTSALVDTGSQVNLLSDKLYDEIGSPRRTNETMALSGLGQMTVYSMGIWPTPTPKRLNEDDSGDSDDDNAKASKIRRLTKSKSDYTALQSTRLLPKEPIITDKTEAVKRKPSLESKALNSTYQRSVDAAPHDLLIGTKMRLNKDSEILDLINKETREIFMNNREDLRIKAKKQILKVQEENKQSYNKKRKKSRKYQVGDVVAIKQTQFGVGMKLTPKYLGPYKITKVKSSDRYDVEKVDQSSEGPKKTSSAADYMKQWPNVNDMHVLSDKGGDSNED